MGKFHANSKEEKNGHEKVLQSNEQHYSRKVFPENLGKFEPEMLTSPFYFLTLSKTELITLHSR